MQPISIIYVFKKDLRESIRWIRSQTDAPIGFNALVEKSSKIYEDRMKKWIDIALEEGVRFFITALGNPDWVVEKVHAVGGIVYHDVTERKWAEKALKANVDGFICVNNRAGGHAGGRSPQELYNSLKDLGKPIICAGGVGSGAEVKAMLDIGYQGVQLGTRFIATQECKVHEDYKKAIVAAKESDIVLTERITGVPVSVIATPYLRKIGTKAGPIAKLLLKGAKTKHWMRMFYTLKSFRSLKISSLKGMGSHKDFWQAGKSVETINSVETVDAVMQDLTSKI